MAQKTFTLGQDSDCDCNALYDENGDIIRAWQEGDEISRVLRDVLSKLGINLNYKSITVDGGYPSKI
jgi:hypothetical protein